MPAPLPPSSPSAAPGEGRDAGVPLLLVRGLSKSFGPTRALRRAELSIAPGEVRGLVGENGSGKSTLVKVLAGYHSPDPGGEVWVGGSPVELPLTGAEARRAGLHFVHQDLGLIPALSVTENLFADRYSVGRSRSIRWRQEHARARASLERFGVEVDPTVALSSLPMEQRVMVAIVRALEGIQGAEGEGSRGGRRGVLVLDEPTVSLPKAGRERLRAMVRREEKK
jgi:ribose transport system ATP-binding protein